jgi:hypothetical protein
VLGHAGFVLGHERGQRVLMRSDGFLHPLELGSEVRNLGRPLIENGLSNLYGTAVKFFGDDLDLFPGFACR